MFLIPFVDSPMVKSDHFYDFPSYVIVTFRIHKILILWHKILTMRLIITKNQTNTLIATSACMHKCKVRI